MLEENDKLSAVEQAQHSVSNECLKTSTPYYNLILKCFLYMCNTIICHCMNQCDTPEKDDPLQSDGFNLHHKKKFCSDICFSICWVTAKVPFDDRLIELYNLWSGYQLRIKLPTFLYLYCNSFFITQPFIGNSKPNPKTKSHTRTLRPSLMRANKNIQLVFPPASRGNLTNIYKYNILNKLWRILLEQRPS